MGLHFGELAKIRGIITYKLSPFEQRAFAGLLSHGFPNSVKRIASMLIRVVPPFAVAYMIYDGVEKKHQQLMRKNPADYENDHLFQVTNPQYETRDYSEKANNLETTLP
ncbi:hypothetical protein R5R35_009076 [Gryllus longicercus]|uniref:Cytochrome b-c1 complex subunit 8 n=1 Tax=Gryllus longicercus TaxID=2509291 RepID=A0AAN9ZCT6_9ORTH